MPQTINDILQARKNSALGNSVNVSNLRKDKDAPKNFGHEIFMFPEDVHVEQQGKTANLYIYDVIGWPWIEARDVIQAVPKNVEHINVHINSPGGDVFEGLAIYNWLKGHSASVSVKIDGLAASIASVVALAGSEVSIPNAAFYMIHDPWVLMLGNSEDLRKEADFLEQIEDVIAGVYADKSGQDKSEIRQWMHNETWFTGVDAKEKGFADNLMDDEPQATASAFNLAMLGGQNKGGASGSGAPASPGTIYQRAAQALNTNQQNNVTEDFIMNEQLRKLLEAQGLDKDATDEQAQNFMQKLLADGKLNAVDQKEIQDAAVKMERQRVQDIRKACRTAKMDGEFTDSLIDEGLSVAASMERIFARMAENNPPMGPGRIESGRTEMEKFKGAAVDGLLMRGGVRVEKPAPGAEQLQGNELASIVRESLYRANVDVSILNSRQAVADYVFRSRQASMTTYDFPEIFRDAADIVLQRRYQEAPATWKAWCNLTTTSDFKNKYVVALSEGPNLKQVSQGGEYSYGAFLDKGESYAPDKYGRIIKLTWEMLVDDNLGAFIREASMLGNAAGRLENELVYNLLTSGTNNHGPTLTSTSRQLFNDTDGNLLQTGRAITADNLDAARQLMRGQKSMKGNHLNINPRFLLVGPKNEMVTDVLLTSAGNVDDNKNAGVTNPMRGKFTSIVESYLGDVFGGLGWYVIADPNQIDTFECAHLAGHQGPDISQREGFTTDSIEWKVRHVFGVGAIEYRGMVLNDGSA